jgi:hypothetical protein
MKASESKRKKVAIPAFCHMLKPPSGNYNIMEKTGSCGSLHSALFTPNYPSKLKNICQ